MRRSKNPSATALCVFERRAGDEASGTIRAGAPRGDDRWIEPARGGAALWDRSTHGQEDAALFAEVNAELLRIEDGKDLQILQSLKDKVDTAYDEDDQDAGKLNRQLEKANEEYRNRKANRDSVVETMGNKIFEKRQIDFNQSVEKFKTEIVTHVPDWSEEVALKNRKFALDLGLNEQFVDTITDPIIVKVLDEYRRLKETSNKGQVKRKKAAVKRVPTKKASSVKTKKSNKLQEARKRISKGRGTSKDDESVFNSMIDNIFDE